MKNKFIITLFLPLVFVSCGLVKTIAVNGNYEPTKSVEIINNNQTLPTGLIRIGSITIDGNQSLVLSYDECSYETCIQTLSDEAKKAGADIVYIVSVVAPNQSLMITLYFYGTSGSGCYTIVADLYIKDKTSDFSQER